MVDIIKVTPNRALTSITVFFDCALVKNGEIDYSQDDKQLLVVKKALKKAAPYIRGRLGQKASLKYAPELEFIPYKRGGAPSQYFVSVT